MKNNKGFVMIETIIVITILSVGLISLYSSYSTIISKARVKNNYDNTEYIYKSYYVGKYILDTETFIPSGLTIYDLESGYMPYFVYFIMEELEIEKIYIINSGLDYKSIINLEELDGSSISYFRKWSDYEKDKINFVVKFKKGIYPREEFNFASLAINKE